MLHVRLLGARSIKIDYAYAGGLPAAYSQGPGYFSRVQVDRLH